MSHAKHMGVAVTLGLAAGLGEAGVLGARFLGSARIAHLNPHAMWAVPIVDAMYLALCAALVAGVGRLVPGLVSRRRVAFLYAFLAWTSVLFALGPELAWPAALVLAAGLTFQTARAIDRRWDRVCAGRTRALRWMLGAVVLIAVATFGVPLAREARATAALPPPPRGAPNVILIVLDTVRAASTSLHGYERPTTPRLAELARSGVTFAQAIAPAPWTLPTHASMFTGCEVRALSADWITPLDGARRTLAEAFAEHGYRTGGFVGNLWYCGCQTGLCRGFAHYDDHRPDLGLLLEAPALFGLVKRELRRRLVGYEAGPRKAAPTVTHAFHAWQARDRDRPYFAFLNYIDAHTPYLPPPPYDRRFGREPPPNPGLELELHRPLPLDANRVADLRAQYDGCVAYLDAHIGELLDRLRAEGALENTIVVVTSDHGEEFGEHGFVSHGSSLFLPALHVPLVVVRSGVVPAGVTVSDPAALRCLGATLLDLAGLSNEAGRFPGRSLAPLWAGGTSEPATPILSTAHTNTGHPTWWQTGPGPVDSVVVGAYHYLHREADGHEALYDHRADPWEERDLTPDPAHAATLAHCRAELARLRANTR